jgi:hypothetical protein
MIRFLLLPGRIVPPARSATKGRPPTPSSASRMRRSASGQRAGSKAQSSITPIGSETASACPSVIA